MSSSGQQREWVNRLIDRARRRLTCGDAAVAGQLAAEALTTAPQAERARLIRARAQLRRNEPAEALRSLDAADWYASARRTRPTDDPLMPAKLMTRAAAMTQLGRGDDAIRVLRAVLAIRPSHRAATLRLATLLVDAGRSDEAIDLLGDYRTAAGDDRRAMRLEADAMEQAGRYDPALTLVRTLSGWSADDMRNLAAGAGGGAAHRSPLPTVGGPRRRRPSRRLLRRIMRLAKQAGHIGQALDACDLLVRGRCDEADTACEAAELAIEVGDDARAVRYLTAALRADHRCAAAARMLARQHLRCGRFASAGRLYWRLMRADDADAESSAGLIVAALCAGRMVFADRLMARFADRFDAASRREQMLSIWRAAMRGQLLDRLRRPATGPVEQDVVAVLLGDAAATLTRSLEGGDRYADLHYHRAICLEALGDRGGAAAALDAALAINGGYVDAATRRAAMMLAGGDTDAALGVIDAARAKRPDAPALVELHAAALSVADRMDEAVAMLGAAPGDARQRGELAEQAAGRLTGLGRVDLAERLRERCVREQGLRLAGLSQAA